LRQLSFVNSFIHSLTVRKTLRNQYSQNWLETQNSSSSTSREKFTHKEVKKSYEFENYLKTVTNPAHRISLTKLRLGCHELRIQTGKYENISINPCRATNMLGM